MKSRIALSLSLAILLAACSQEQQLGISVSEAEQVIAAAARQHGSSFSITENGQTKRSAETMAEWLRSNPQPPVPSKNSIPKEGRGCEVLTGPTRFVNYVPPSVKAAIEATNSKPWALVRYDIDKMGHTYNIRPLRNSGYKEFADTALITVALWSYSGQSKAYGLKNCVGWLRAN
ncbi:hypothetical protein WJT86_04535 [Microvirga sp. W0021]|uniref:Lipoprotein n=1 Tax=Hohaiivirga grylli TaxID=3133970 RepID=A0ABV0BH87_9HYPH